MSLLAVGLFGGSILAGEAVPVTEPTYGLIEADTQVTIVDAAGYNWNEGRDNVAGDKCVMRIDDAVVLVGQVGENVKYKYEGYLGSRLLDVGNNSCDRGITFFVSPEEAAKLQAAYAKTNGTDIASAPDASTTLAPVTTELPKVEPGPAAPIDPATTETGTSN